MKLIGLAEFRTGDDVRRFTTSANEVLWDGHIWYPAPTRHSDVRHTQELEKNDVRFDFPIDSEFARAFLGYGPDEPTMVTLYRNTIGDESDFDVFWPGRVADCEANDKEITLICESLLTAANNNGLSERMQKFCRHVVYHDLCNLDKEDFGWPSAVTAIDSRLSVITCPAAATYPDDWFTGGILTLPTGALRYITRHTGTQIVLWRPCPEIFEALALGSVSTTLYPGCDGSLNTCHEKFNNLDNNGGFYWIPEINPTGGTSIF